MNRRRFTTSFLCSALLAGSWSGSAAAMPDADAAPPAPPAGDTMPAMMIVYDHGKTTKLTPESRESKHVASECTRLLQNATGIVRRTATPDQIDGIKRGEYALELIYDAPVSLEILKLSDHSVTFTRMFVPMSGQYAQNVSTVFVDKDEIYDSMIYRSNASTTAMRSYIQTMVEQMKKRSYYPPF